MAQNPHSDATARGHLRHAGQDLRYVGKRVTQKRNQVGRRCTGADHVQTRQDVVATEYSQRRRTIYLAGPQPQGVREPHGPVRSTDSDVGPVDVVHMSFAALRPARQEDLPEVHDAQTGYALATIWISCPASNNATKPGRGLADLVRESGYRISTGFVGTPLVADALTLT